MTRRMKTHIRLGIRSVSPSDQSPRCPHEETLGPYIPIAKFRIVVLSWGGSPMADIKDMQRDCRVFVSLINDFLPLVIRVNLG